LTSLRTTELEATTEYLSRLLYSECNSNKTPAIVVVVVS